MRTVKLPPVDECKVLICEMKIFEIESVLAYGKYWLSQMKKRQSILDKKEKDKSKA